MLATRQLRNILSDFKECIPIWELVYCLPEADKQQKYNFYRKLLALSTCQCYLKCAFNLPSKYGLIKTLVVANRVAMIAILLRLWLSKFSCAYAHQKEKKLPVHNVMSKADAECVSSVLHVHDAYFMQQLHLQVKPAPL